MDHLIGMRLGSCVLDRPLGIGGMGAVYLARQERPHRQVAVKVLHPQLMAEPGAWSVFLTRFRREADATAALDHTNIIPIHEFGEQDGIAYLVMPYLPDGSLADLLARVGRLPVETALGYLAQAAAALDYAHAHGIIHRDVKPSNLLLHADGRLLLADFGLARPMRQPEPPVGMRSGGPPADLDLTDAALTMAGTVMGTPQYMAPEQILGEPVGAATDVYALGIVAYLLLAGQLPFDGAPPSEILRRQLGMAPPPVRAFRPELPPAMEQVIGWALAKRPAERPASAGAFVAALGQAARAPMGQAARYAGRPVGISAGDAPTVYDGRSSVGPGGAARAGGAMWPGGAGMSPAARSASGGAHPFRVACLSMLVTVLVVCGGLGMLLSAGWGRTTGRTGGLTARHATPTPTPSPTPVVNWLTVSPSTVRLGCGEEKTATVVLRNAGPRQTWWSATVAPWGSLSVEPGVSVLPSGNSVTITLTNTSYAIFGPGHTGTVTLQPSAAAAGVPAIIRFTTEAC